MSRVKVVLVLALVAAATFWSVSSSIGGCPVPGPYMPDWQCSGDTLCWAEHTGCFELLSAYIKIVKRYTIEEIVDTTSEYDEAANDDEETCKCVDVDVFDDEYCLIFLGTDEVSVGDCEACSGSVICETIIA